MSLCLLYSPTAFNLCKFLFIKPLFLNMQKVGEKQIIMNTKENNKQHDKQISETKVYWCESCNLPIYLDTCPMCGQATKYVATDARVVFPEEKLLLAIIEKKEPLAYENSFVINNINTYIIDGIKHTISIQKLKELPMDEILYIKQEFVICFLSTIQSNLLYTNGSTKNRTPISFVLF